ncbi:MAG: winged helix-turn-helix domain-containing protein, partial [Pyrinomonadaceae bacterium]|nr:winged helix-turn-helix domain-containing protein [Pyrinomonadaceae bacterium]
MMNDPANNFYEFDSFQVDVRRRLLLHEGQPVRVTPKAFEILLGLVRSGGRVVSKDEMMSTVWPGCFVEEGNLAQNIFLLRRILGEQKNEHKFIITIPGVGYRFAPYVRESAGALAVRKAPVGGGQKINCIAVLPLKPLSPNELDPSLGVGIADALITKLCSLKLVKVMPTATMLRLVGPSQNFWLAPSDLEVDALLDGLYQRDGEQLRVSVQLILAREGTMLWAEKFDVEFTSLFALQDALSEQVASALAERLQGVEKPNLSVVRHRRKASLRRCS